MLFLVQTVTEPTGGLLMQTEVVLVFGLCVCVLGLDWDLISEEPECIPEDTGLPVFENSSGSTTGSQHISLSLVPGLAYGD